MNCYYISIIKDISNVAELHFVVLMPASPNLFVHPTTVVISVRKLVNVGMKNILHPIQYFLQWRLMCVYWSFTSHATIFQLYMETDDEESFDITT